MKAKEHWEGVHRSRAETEVSWFQGHAKLSLKLIRGMGVTADAAIIDVGGGAGTLVDDLLLDGYRRITVPGSLGRSAVGGACKTRRDGRTRAMAGG